MTKTRLTDRHVKHREIPMGLFFLKYFLYIFVGIVLVVILLAGLFGILLKNDLIYEASYAEKQAKAAVTAIQSAEQVTPDLIPDLCQYAVFDREGHMLSGDMGEKEALRAWNVINGREYNGGTYIGADYYLGIPRRTECCVLRYQLIVQYRSAVLRSVSVRFNVAVRKKLMPLADAADRIQRQELEFRIARGCVREINTILDAMDKMRIALQESLERQWRMEQTKNEQISALAHDLKTPLTLVRGNAELLADTHLTEEQNEYADFIMNSALQMQDYVQMMIEVVRSSVTMPVNRRQIPVVEFLEELKRQAGGLCAVQHVALKWNCTDFTGKIYAEPRLLMRAFMNIFANAVEHTPSGDIIMFEGRQDETHFVFSITDSGKGFTPNALCHAKEQFYMDDGSRSAAGSHYGMGLYIVDTIVRQHDGELILENAPCPFAAKGRGPVPADGCMHGGAKVNVKIPRL